MTCMLVHGLLYMPTIPVANSVAFRHIPDPSQFPRIAVFGTLGWICANLIVEVFLGGAANPNFLILAGGGSVLLALYSLSLPHTPPKGAEAGGDLFGLKALKLLKEFSFLVFIAGVFLCSIPACGYYFATITSMLGQRGYPNTVALSTLGQFSEIAFMFTMPWFVHRFGLKKVLLIGMASWAIRYFCFMPPFFAFAVLGLLLHGACYSFLYVGSYMYVDKRAPAELKASAQSLLTFLLIGVGWFLGAKGAGMTTDHHPAAITTMAHTTTIQITELTDYKQADAQRKDGKNVCTATIEAKLNNDKISPDHIDSAVVTIKKSQKSLPQWNNPAAKKSIFRYLDLAGTLKSLLATKDSKEAEDSKKTNVKHDLSELANSDGKITWTELQQLPEDGVKFGPNEKESKAYTKKELIDIFYRVARLKDTEVKKEDISVDRQAWLKSQSNDWMMIYLYPGIVAAVIAILFGLLFHEKKEEEANEPSETPEEPKSDDDDGAGEE